jgi:hypothetical protein
MMNRAHRKALCGVTLPGVTVAAASEQRARDYGVGVCVVCGRPFKRRSGNSKLCGEAACRRRRKTQTARRFEAKRKRRRRLAPVEQALHDLCVQLVYDDARTLGFPQAEARWAALLDCRASQRDPGARIALRQCWIDLAAVAMTMASELPEPSIAPHLERHQHERLNGLVAAANAA